MKNFKTDYILMTLLALPLLVPVFGSNLVQAFDSGLKMNKLLEQVPQQMTSNFDDSISIVQDKLETLPGLVSTLGLNVDVEAIVKEGNIASVMNTDKLSLLQKVNLINTINTAQASTQNLLDNATAQATKSSYMFHPGDSLLGNSFDDVKKELDTLQSTVENQIKLAEDIKKLYKGLNLMMSLKMVFLREKYDYPKDVFIVCNDYLPGTGVSIFPLIAEAISLADVQMPGNIPYESMFETFKSIANKGALLSDMYNNLKGGAGGLQGLSKQEMIEMYEKGTIPASLLSGGTTPLELAKQYGKSILEVSNQVTKNNISGQFLTELTMLENMRINFTQELDMMKQRQKEFQYLILIQKLINLVNQVKQQVS